ncbi:hypothetical protein CHS0354_010318 [Potamilus streckersoni]|uniref:Uncharacterized protein n=1 Tax=Potamilus streckersoni TaxID=2493646 RepID=A0AAE0TDY1_9BIVA|nr:hypothetical protein CHS0354_010318 [Potamilus streckersoni]
MRFMVKSETITYIIRTRNVLGSRLGRCVLLQTSIFGQLSDSIMDLDKELEDMTDSIMDLDKELEDMTDSIMDWDKELEDMTDSIMDWDKEVEDMTDSIMDWDKELEDMKGQMSISDRLHSSFGANRYTFPEIYIALKLTHRNYYGVRFFKQNAAL